MFDSSISGIRSGLAMAERAANNIARFESADPKDFVDMMVAERAVEANVCGATDVAADVGTSDRFVRLDESHLAGGCDCAAESIRSRSAV